MSMELLTAYAPGVTECPRLGKDCAVTMWQNPVRFTRFFQHGDNPEHRIEIDEYDFQSGKEVTARIVEWVNRIHEYERGQ